MSQNNLEAKIVEAISNNCQKLCTQTIFITCASFEERCLGLPKILTYKYTLERAYVFVYQDPSQKRAENLQKLKEILELRKTLVREIQTSEGDPIPAIGVLYQDIKEISKKNVNLEIDLDITTFTKRHLLLLFKAIDDLELWDKTRIFYTEPRDYVADLYLPMSRGLKTLGPISGFLSTVSPTLPELLVIFLGYEGDRALAVYENTDPEETILVIPKPAYHKEWEGRTEKMNRSLIQMIGKGHVEDADAIDPSKVVSTLEKIARKYDASKWRWVIVPLGTKPQTLGIYEFWRANPNTFSVIYAQPLKHNESFFSTGIGPTWMLKQRQC
jgi:hypothetical protein